MMQYLDDDEATKEVYRGNAFTIGNVAAGFALKGISTLEQSGVIGFQRGWRWMFLIGAVPALLVIEPMRPDTGARISVKLS